MLQAVIFRGSWDASGGTYPASPANGDLWKVSVGGTVSGTVYAVGDNTIYDGSVWDKIDNTEAVTSVAGKVGAVTLASTDLTDSSNVARLDANQLFTGSNSFDGNFSVSRGDNILPQWGFANMNSSNTDAILKVSSISGHAKVDIANQSDNKQSTFNAYTYGSYTGGYLTAQHGSSSGSIGIGTYSDWMMMGQYSPVNVLSIQTNAAGAPTNVQLGLAGTSSCLEFTNFPAPGSGGGSNSVMSINLDGGGFDPEIITHANTIQRKETNVRREFIASNSSDYGMFEALTSTEYAFGFVYEDTGSPNDHAVSIIDLDASNKATTLHLGRGYSGGAGITISNMTSTISIGFFDDVAGAQKQSVTGSRGGNAALASLLTALENYGLIFDNTSV